MKAGAEAASSDVEFAACTASPGGYTRNPACSAYRRNSVQKHRAVFGIAES